MSDEKSATPITLVVHSTPGYTNNALFFRALDENLARWRIVRIIAEQGSAAATMAAYWCKLHGIKLVVVLADLSTAPINDRKRRYLQMAEEKPHAAFFFNQAAHWLDFAQTLHDGGVPVFFVYSRAQRPDYLRWQSGITRMPPMADELLIARDVRKGRPRKLLTPEERAARKKEATARFDEKRRFRKNFSKGMKISALARRRKERKLAITRHG